MNKSVNVLNQIDDPLDYITQHLEEAISVEASAGCGKTYALIARVCELLKSGRTSIERLLLLTFTENAAAEMKNRLIEILNEKKDEDWAQNALEKLHLASIQTIHAFAYDICKAFHDSLGLPEDISITDPFDQQKLLSSFFDSRYNSWGNEPALLSFFQVCKILGMKRTDFKQAFTQIIGKITYIPGDIRTPANFQTEELDKALKQGSKPIQKSADDVCTLASSLNITELTDSQAERVTRFTDFAYAISEMKSPIQLTTLVRNPEKFKKSSKFEIKLKTTFSSEYMEFENAVAELGRTRTGYLNSIADSILRLATDLLFELALDFRYKTFSEGQITFDDSIIAARRAVETETSREQLWGKFDSIIVDEFQDTDIHQLAIIDYLAQDQSADELARLFVVGDEKQSIYGFRGATVKGYKHFVRTRPIKRIALSESRRSVPAVTEVVNIISDSMLNEYVPMKTTRKNLDETPNYHVKIVGDELARNVEEIRVQQSTDVISVLAQMNLSAEIFDKKLETKRPCNYADMALLIRDKNSLPSVTSELEAQKIPYTIDSSALVWELTMVRVFLAIATAVTQPRNGFAVVAALKTPIYSIDNDDLVKYAEQCRKHNELSESGNKNLWDYRQSIITESENSASNKVCHALESLDSLHKIHNLVTPLKFVQHILYETPFFQSFVVTSGQAQAISVARFLMSDVIAYQDSHSLSGVYEYVEHLINSYKNSIKSDSVIENPEHDKLRVLTIHSSKGLEFPIVGFIPSHAKAKNSGMKVIELDSKKNTHSLALSLSANVFDSRLADYKDSYNESFLDEESRLIYVAMTRAQDHLVLSAHHKKAKSPNNQSALIGRGAIGLDRYVVGNESNDDKAHSTTASNIRSIQEIRLETSKEHELRSSRRKNLLTNISRSGHINATSIKPDDFLLVEQHERELPFLASSQAPSIGRAVHRVMNIIDFEATDETIKNLCQQCGFNEGIHSQLEINKCVEMVKRALAIPMLTEPKVEITREVPISGKIEGMYCEGYIDCLAKTSSGYVIIDYKTDTIDNHRPLDTKITLHSFQLAFYSLLLKQVLNIERCKAVLLFLNYEKMPYVEVENLAFNENLVRKKLKSMKA